MAALAKFLQYGLLTWMALLVLLIGVRMLRGQIKIDGFLAHKKSGRELAPERVVSVVVFPVVIGMYAIQALGADLSTAGGRPVMPDVPDYLLSLLVGGNSLYLAGKMLR